MSTEHDDDRFDPAEAFERFFESVAYHGFKRGMRRFTGELSGRTPSPPGPRGPETELEAERPVDARPVAPDRPYVQPALPPRAEGQLPAPLVRRRGRLPKQRELQSEAEDSTHGGSGPAGSAEDEKDAPEGGDTES
jgi:hypothetical protein